MHASHLNSCGFEPNQLQSLLLILNMIKISLLTKFWNFLFISMYIVIVATCIMEKYAFMIYIHYIKMKKKAPPLVGFEPTLIWVSHVRCLSISFRSTIFISREDYLDWTLIKNCEFHKILVVLLILIWEDSFKYSD